MMCGVVLGENKGYKERNFQHISDTYFHTALDRIP